MQLPDPQLFTSLAIEHDFVPVYRQLLSDALTPVTAFRLLDDGGSACLFESVVGGEKVGRYSFLAASPIRRFCATRHEIKITDLVTGETECSKADDPLDAFRSNFHYRVAEIEGLPPFVGGAIGYAGYDVVRYVEELPNAPEDDRGLPDLDFSFYHTLVVFDHVAKTVTIISLADCRDVETVEQAEIAYQKTVSDLDVTRNKLATREPHCPSQWNPEHWASKAKEQPLELKSNFTQDDFEASVRKCVEYLSLIHI